MQKLAILIFLTIVLTPLISAEEDQILLAQDILYWKNDHEDILVPDVFYMSSLLPEKDMFSMYFIPLFSNPQSWDLVYSEWTIPSLYYPDIQQARQHELTLWAESLYGSGVSFKGNYDRFSYNMAGNLSHWDTYPHWAKSGLAVKGPDQEAVFVFSYRNERQSSLMGMIDWNVSLSGNSFKGSIQSAVFSLSGIDDQSHQLAAELNSDYAYYWNAFGLKIGLDADYLKDFSSASSAGGRLSPELTVEKTILRQGGQWRFSLGSTADLNSDLSYQFFPAVEINFIAYGVSSLTFLWTAESLDRKQEKDFILQEQYESAVYGLYRWQHGYMSYSGIHENWETQFLSGVKWGYLPELDSGQLQDPFYMLFYAQADLEIPVSPSLITIITAYADYREREFLRFYGENRWILPLPSGNWTLSSILFAGNRDIIRGFSDIYHKESDILLSGGIEADFNSIFVLAGSVAYVLDNTAFEGQISCRFSF